jgi:hypothetical protein
MSPRTITLLSLLALLAGLGTMGWATWRLAELDGESARLAAAGRDAGASFEQTLQGEHAARQFKAFDDRRAVALTRGAARRDRLFGVLLAAAGALGLATAAAFRRMAREIEEERRHLEGAGPDRPPPAADGG